MQSFTFSMFCRVRSTTSSAWRCMSFSSGVFVSDLGGMAARSLPAATPNTSLGLATPNTSLGLATPKNTEIEQNRTKGQIPASPNAKKPGWAGLWAGGPGGLRTGSRRFRGQFEYRLFHGEWLVGCRGRRRPGCWDTGAGAAPARVRRQHLHTGQSVLGLRQTWRVIRGRVVEGGQLPRWISSLARRRCCHPSTVSFPLHVCSLPGGGWGELL